MLNVWFPRSEIGKKKSSRQKNIEIAELNDIKHSSGSDIKNFYIFCQLHLLDRGQSL